MRLILCLGSLFFFQFASAIVDGPSILEDSGIHGRTYAVVKQSLRSLAERFPLQSQVLVYGHSVRGEDLTAIRIQSPRSFSHSRPAILITEATHGNENLEIAPYLPENFLERQSELQGLAGFLDRGGVLYVIPVFNPDGYDMRQRRNVNNIDLNRDFDFEPGNFAGFTQPETRDFNDFLKNELSVQNAALKLTLDYHCCVGAMLYPWSNTRDPIPAADLAIHRAYGNLMKQYISPSYRYGSFPEILRYYATGTSQDYFYTEFGAIGLTFEGAYRTEKDNLEKHVQMWNVIFSQIQ